MKKIKVTIEISHINTWGVDWTNADKFKSELLKLKYDIQRTISDHCGIEYSHMDVNSILIEE